MCLFWSKCIVTKKQRENLGTCANRYFALAGTRESVNIVNLDQKQIRCRCTGSTCRYHAQSACPVSSQHVQSAYPVSVVFCQKSYPLRHRFSSTLLFSYAWLAWYSVCCRYGNFLCVAFSGKNSAILPHLRFCSLANVLISRQMHLN